MQRAKQKSCTLIDQQVGSRVRMRRLMLKLSQTDLADGLGLTFQQVQKYEKGMNRIGAGRLQQIAHILQVPVTFFFETPSPNPPPTVAQDQSLAKLNDFMATRDGLTLAKAFMRIDDVQLRRRLVDLVEAIAQRLGPGINAANSGSPYQAPTSGSISNMSIYDEYWIVINEAQRRLIMRALTNAMANDRLSTEGGALSRSMPDEWMQLIRMFSTIRPSVRNRPEAVAGH
jgi:transcriptional regulator with XRE-family HTH domain